MNSHVLSDLVSPVVQRTLTTEEIHAVANDLLDATVPDSTKTEFLRAWARRGETAAELAACAEAFLPRAVDPGLRGSWHDKALLDCCGTGGGGLDLLNISTGLMFILSAMGIPVVKHGNRGITKRSGSADVLEAMGIRIDLPPEDVPRCLEEVGCAFLFAPAYHTTFAAIAGVRKALAAENQRTVFNLIGPLLNPARPDSRLVGVFKEDHVALYRDALELMKCPHFTIVYGQDAETCRPLGEASANGESLLGSSIRLPATEPIFRLLRKSNSGEHLDSLLVRNADESASRLETILSGEDQGLDRETMILNAAIAAWTHGTCSSIEEGVASATEMLDSSRALEQMRKWQKFSE